MEVVLYWFLLLIIAISISVFSSFLINRWRYRILIFLSIFLISMIDIPYASYKYYSLCKEEAGLKAYEKIDPFFGYYLKSRIISEKDLYSSRIEYVEYGPFSQTGENRYKRLRRNGDGFVLDEMSEVTAKYEFVNRPSRLDYGYGTKKVSGPKIVNRESRRVIAEYVVFDKTAPFGWGATYFLGTNGAGLSCGLKALFIGVLSINGHFIT